MVIYCYCNNINFTDFGKEYLEVFRFLDFYISRFLDF